MSTTAIPEAIRICPTCSEPASGERCESCTSLQAQARTTACELIRQGVQSLVIARSEDLLPSGRLYLDLVEFHFHAMRAAQLNARLPQVSTGMQVQPGTAASWYAVGRRLFWWTALCAAFWAAVFYLAVRR